MPENPKMGLRPATAVGVEEILAPLNLRRLWGRRSAQPSENVTKGRIRQSRREEAEGAETQNERITEQFPSWGSGRLSTSWMANRGLRFPASLTAEPSHHRLRELINNRGENNADNFKRLVYL